MATSQYRFAERIVPTGHPEFMSLVATAHSRAERPHCMCNGTVRGLEVYVARRHQKFVIHRMPGTGPLHAPSCGHFEPADDLTGLGQVRGHAVIDDDVSGETTLKLGFPLSRGSARMAAAAASAEDKPSVKSDGTKLSIRGFLHYLWNDAHLTHWHPLMERKRNWFIVRKALLGAAETKQSKGRYLASMLYVPERFALDDKPAIQQRRRETTARAIATTKQLMVIIAEVKNFEVSRYGEKIVCKHLPDWPLFMDDQLAKRLHKNFEREIEFARGNDKDHLIICATFEIGKSDFAHVRELTLMAVNESWLPYESTTDRALVEQCVAQKRHFIKGMRMNLDASSPIAALILTDTKPRATALYLRQVVLSRDNQAVLDERMSYTGVVHHILMPGDKLPAHQVEAAPNST